MESEIAEQPALLASNANRFLREMEVALTGQSFDLVVLVARGSSDHAALFARYLIEVSLRVPVSLAAPSVLTRYKSDLKYPKSLVVGISQSGSAPDVSEVLAHARNQGHTTLALTNTAKSRITDCAEHSVLLECGPELALAATKTYTNSLLAILQMVRAMGGDFAPFEPPTQGWLEACRESAGEASGVVVRSAPTLALARGFSFCSALETALKLMECALIPCKAYSTADFAHGPQTLARHGSAVIGFGDTPDLADQGCDVIQAPAPPVSDEIKPIWEILFSQHLALSVARARGLNPDTVEFLSKVTRTL